MTIARAPSRPGRRILFIKPSAYDQRGRLIRGPRAFFPSRTLPYLAALTPPGFDLRIIDDAVQDWPIDHEADLVVLTGMLPNMPRAIDIARGFHQRGIPTVIGGIGVFSVRKLLADSGVFTSIVDGEAEPVWPTILADHQRGQLQAGYCGGHDAQLAGLPTARYDLVDMRRYWRMPGHSRPLLAVETARGCPFDCSFCAVTLYFGRRMRFRPVGDVIDEIRRLGATYVIFSDDDLMADADRAAELFAALKPLGIRWGGQFGIAAARHPEVMRLAAQSGCRNAMVGIESLTPQNLRDVNKGRAAQIPVEHVAEVFRAAGVAMTASMIFGLEHDTVQSLGQTTDRLIHSGADFLLPWILCPGPGCEVHAQFQREGRLLHQNYSLYNGIDVVFRPRHMTPAQLARASQDALKRFYSLARIAGRSWRAADKLDVLGLSLYFWNAARLGRHPFYGVT